MRKKMIIELIINALLLVVPIFAIVSGIIRMLNHDPLHPDAVVAFGIVVLGLISAVMTIISITRLYKYGWKRLPTYQKTLAIAYPTVLIICIFLAPSF